MRAHQIYATGKFCGALADAVFRIACPLLWLLT